MTAVHIVQSSWGYFMHHYKIIEGVFSTKPKAEEQEEILKEAVQKNHLGYTLIRTEIHTITLDQPIDTDKYTKPLKGKI